MSNSSPSASWQPGQSGNLNGRPKSAWTWASLVRKAMDEVGEDGKRLKGQVSKALVTKALTGDVQAIKEIGDRIDGKPKQSIEAKIETEVTVYNKLNDEELSKVIKSKASEAGVS